MNLHTIHENCASTPKGNLVRLVTASGNSDIKRTNLKICDSCETIVKFVQVEMKESDD